MTKVSKGDGTANSVGIVALPQDFIEETRAVKDLMFSAIGEVPVDVEHFSFRSSPEPEPSCCCSAEGNPRLIEFLGTYCSNM